MKCLYCGIEGETDHGFCLKASCQAQLTRALNAYGEIPVGGRVLITRHPSSLGSGADGCYCAQAIYAHETGKPVMVMIRMKPYTPPYLPGWFRRIDIDTGQPFPAPTEDHLDGNPTSDQWCYSGLYERVA